MGTVGQKVEQQKKIYVHQVTCPNLQSEAIQLPDIRPQRINLFIWEMWIRPDGVLQAKFFEDSPFTSYLLQKCTFSQ